MYTRGEGGRRRAKQSFWFRKRNREVHYKQAEAGAATLFDLERFTQARMGELLYFGA